MAISVARPPPPLRYRPLRRICQRTAMPLSWNEIKDRALRFSRDWADAHARTSTPSPSGMQTREALTTSGRPVLVLRG